MIRPIRQAHQPVKRNPSKNGYYCHVYSTDEYTHIADTLIKCIIVAESKEEARVLLEKAIKYDPEKDPEYKYILEKIIIYS